MKSNSKTILILIVLGIVFALSTISKQNFSDDQRKNGFSLEIRDETNLESPKKSGAYTESFIHIDGNWSAAEAEDWCYGDGSFINPYIIENVTIDASSSPTRSGIFINNSKNDCFIIRNCTIYSSGSGSFDGGIKLENTCNGTLINNNCSYNGKNGIFLYKNCNNNTILENTATNNGRGIYLWDDCDTNTISNNTFNRNGAGIMIRINCDNNTISRNTANDNTSPGIYLKEECHNNTISYNIASNQRTGISLETNCSNNKIIGNVAKNNTYGAIYLKENCDNNTISENAAINTDMPAISVIFDFYECDYNNITDNYIYFSTNYELVIGGNDNIIKENVFVSKDDNFIEDFGSNTIITHNDYMHAMPHLCVDVIEQSFSNTTFVITINISSGLGVDPWVLSIQMWWNGTAVPSNNITELGNGLYNISLTPIFVIPGDYVLLNMTIISANHKDKYFNMKLAVDPEAVKKPPPPQPQPQPQPPVGVGDDDDDDGDEPSAIPGYELYLVIGAICVISAILIKKRRKIN